MVTTLASCCEPGNPRIYEAISGDGRDCPLGATKAVHLEYLVDVLSQEFDFDAIDASVL